MTNAGGRSRVWRPGTEKLIAHPLEPSRGGRAVAAALCVLALLVASRDAAGGGGTATQPAGELDTLPLVPARYLPRIAEADVLGLGPEAKNAVQWLAGRTRVRLRSREGAFSLVDAGGRTLALSRSLGFALQHCEQFAGMIPATLGRPVTTKELREAFLSEEGVARVRKLFTRTMRSAVIVEGRPVLLETGGEATLQDGSISLIEIPDVTREATLRLSGLADDPKGVRRLYEEEPLAMSLIDERGTLGSVLELLPRWKAKGIPLERRRRMLRKAIANVVENAADSWTLTPEAHLETVARTQWSGRYVGLWHTHPPAFKGDHWIGGDPPSPDDRRIARERGQYVTIAFKAGGFVVYDLSPLAAMSGGAPEDGKIVFRSEAWRRRFEALRKELAAQVAPAVGETEPRSEPSIRPLGCRAGLRH